MRNEIGVIYGELGEYQKTLDYYDQALALARSRGNRDLEVNMLDLEADVYTGIGDEDKAFTLLLSNELR